MSATFIFSVVIELIALAFILYGIKNEEKFIDFEDEIIRKIGKKIYLYRRRKAIEKRRKDGKHLRAVPENGRRSRQVRQTRQKTGRKVA